MHKRGINGWPEDERPREMLLKKGPEHLSPAQLLAIILRTGSEGKSALELAMELLDHFSGLSQIANASVYELCKIKGIGHAKAIQIKAAIEIGKRAMGKPLKSNKRIRSSKDVYEVCLHYVPQFKGLKKEVFRVLMLDSKNRIFAESIVSQGSLTSSIVHPREVFAPAIKNSAASLIFLHNHPSGDPTPSPEDVEITRRLVKAGEIIGIKVLDHIIIGDEGYMSFADNRLI